MSGQSTPGLRGITLMLASASLGFVQLAFSAGTVAPLFAGGAAIVLSLWAVQAINKR